MGERAGRAGDVMADSQVSVGAALSFAWSFWRGHWREIWGALALNGLAFTVFFAGVFAYNLNLVAAGGAALMFTVYSVYGAVIRLAFAADHPDDPEYRLGAQGLQWRRMELRMLGANLLVTFFMLVLGLLLVVCLLAPVIAMVMSKGGPLPTGMTLKDLDRMLGPEGMIALQVGELVVRLIMIFVLIRLSLYLPASAESGRIAVFKTWKLTRGRFWQIFASTLVITLPTVLILGLGGLPVDGQSAPLSPGETFLYSLVCGGWAGAVAAPLCAAIQAYFYRNLRSVS